MNILIVDDVKSIRLLHQTFLEEAGYQSIYLAESAYEAFRILNVDNPEAPVTIDVILMDIQMPIMDGIEACRFIKKKNHLKDIPIIIVTSKTDEESLQQAFDAGAIDYITKSKGKIEFLARVRSALALKKEMDMRKARELEILNIGANIQKSLLVSEPPKDIPQMDIGVLTIPSHRIDGDFYEFFKHSETCVDVVIADVMGKGVSAALLGAAVKTHFFRAIQRLKSLSDTIPAPDEIVMEVHKHITKELIQLNSFVTLCYTRFDLNQNQIYLVDAGHTKTIHFQAVSNTVCFLEGQNLPLGLDENEVYYQIKFDIEPGDTLFFYSDGFIDARNENKIHFGANALAELIKNNGTQPPHQLIQTVWHSLSMLYPLYNSDDLTCIAVKILAPKKKIPLIRSELTISSDFNELATVRSFIRNFWRIPVPIKGFDEVIAWEVELAVHEAVANVVEHSYHNLPNRWIHIEVELFYEKVDVRIFHEGDPFTLESLSVDIPENSKDRGLGLYIIRETMDKIQYLKTDVGKNIIYLSKNLSKKN